MTAPPIQDGELLIENGRIASVGRAVSTRTDPDVLDLRDAIVIPGLVNAHTHLEYTVFRGLLEDAQFFPWIRSLVQLKQHLRHEDWLASAIVGAAEAASAGITTIGDCTDSGAALYAASALGLKGVIYQEVFALDPGEPLPVLLERLQGSLQRLTGQAPPARLRIGVSPHAPYTLHPRALKAVAQFARERDLPICIHAAESLPEALLLLRNGGEFARLLHDRGIDWWEQPPAKSPVAYLEDCGILSSKTLLVHGVQITRSDLARTARAGAAWVHCPKSNAKLGNGVSPLLALTGFREPGSAGGAAVPVGLGSDSVASNNTMDLFEEMRFALLLHRAHNQTAEAPVATDLLYLSTLGGASALGMAHETGSLEPGKWADLTAVSLRGLRLHPCYDPVVTLVHSATAADVILTMVEGRVVYSRRGDRQSFHGLTLAPWRRRFASVARKLAGKRGRA